MATLYKKFLSNPYFWIFLAWFIILLPLSILGSPGFYNDDFMTFKSLEDSGLRGSVNGWFENFGFGYRPLSVIIHYTFYSFLPQNSVVLYAVYQLIYLTISLVLYKQIYSLTHEAKAGLFVALFFLFFPFNAVAFWQIPSITMIIAILFAIPVVKNIVTLSGSKSNIKLSLYILIWALLLLTYEQLTGLVVVIVALILIINFKESISLTIRGNIVPILALASVSAACTILYFSSEGNPKLVSLKIINSASQIQEINLEEKDRFGEVINSINDKNNYENKFDLLEQLFSRFKSFSSRVLKGFEYLELNTHYALKNLLSIESFGLLMILIILIPGIIVLFMPPSFLILRKVNPLYYLTIGFFWALSSLAPFFLYNEVHIPPYTLILPSIGLGIFLVGASQYTQRFLSKKIFNLISKILLIFIVTFFPLNQYGYYLGLKEEILYWDKVANSIKINNLDLSNSNIEIEGISKKENSHIFWLEDAVGIRYISYLLNGEFNVSSVSINNEKIILTKAINK